MTRSPPAPINKVLPAIVGGPATSPLQQSAEQIQNQRKRTKKISAAGRANKRSVASGAGSSYAFAAEDIQVSSKAGRDGKSRQVDADLQESKFKNSDPIPTRPLSMKFATIEVDMQRSKFKNRDPIPTRPP